MDSDGLPFATIADVSRLVRSGEVRSVALTELMLARIAAHDGVLNAFVTVTADTALEQASAADRELAGGLDRGPLHGVPIAIKDLFDTRGVRTTSGMKLHEHRIPDGDATVVERLRHAGAVMLGKTNMDEFAMGSSTENSAMRVTKNPWDTSRVPGGSSGGSAAAVAARLCPAALGSDTGGSIRQPAAFCGVVGFKPTYGRISRYGLVAFGSSLDQIGPMTVDVADAALLSSVLAAHDDRDSTSIPAPAENYVAELAIPFEKPLKIGLPKEYYTDALGGEVRAQMDTAIESLKTAGCEFVDVSLPHSRIDIDDDGTISSFAVACYYIVCMAEASSNLGRYDGVHYGHRTENNVEDIVELFSRSRSEALGEEVKRRILLGTYTLSSGYYDAYYNKALKVRRLIHDDFTAAFESCDVLLCPTTPAPAFAIGEKTADPLEMYLGDIYTISANLAGLPGLALPCGQTDAGLPVGCQFVGPVLSESLLLRAGMLFEKATGIARLRPPR